MKDSKGNIINAFIHKSVQNSDRSITSTVWDSNNKMMLQYRYYPDGTSKLLFRAPIATLGWFGEFDKCIGQVGAPFKSNLANVD